ncbi:hypothetical protein ABPG74_007651 [Tetrahymena malaccensis]
MAYYFYHDESNRIYFQNSLEVIQCNDPSLKGYNCIQYSNNNNNTLLIDTNNKVTSSVYFRIYGCNDIDIFKTTIPDNCASQSEIDDVVNGIDARLKIKMKTQQYITTSKSIQTNYRNTRHK